MAVYVSYNGKVIEPAPIYSISTEYVRSESNAVINVNHVITLTGTILPNRGNPSSAGTFADLPAVGFYPTESIVDNNDKFGSLIKKKAAIKELFDSDHKTLLIEDIEDSSRKIQCKPIVTNVSFSAGVMVDKLDYTITLSTRDIDNYKINNPVVDMGLLDDVFTNPSNISDLKGIKSISIAPQIVNVEDDDHETFNVSLNVSVGCEKFDNTSSGNAKAVFGNARTIARRICPTDVNDKNLTNSYLVDIFDGSQAGALSNYELINQNITEGGDHLAGTYSMSYSALAIKKGSNDSHTVSDDFTVSFSKQNKTRGAQLGVNNVISINGTITGRRTPDQTKATAASVFWSTVLKNGDMDKIQERIFDNSPSIIGEFDNYTFNNSALNLTARSSQVSFNKRAGTISYSFEFLDKGLALQGTPFADADISVTQNTAVQTIAAIPILGRANGPIIQNINTPSSRTVSVSANFVLRTNGGYTSDKSALRKYSEVASTLGLRAAAMDILKSEPFNIFDGSQDVNYFITSFSDTINPLSGSYNLSMNILEVDTSKEVSVVSSS